MTARRALVVDDSKSARFALRKFLQVRDFEVDTAESADEAFRYLKSERPDVMFLDHVMPGMDGFDALRQLRGDEATRDIPVVICSSNDGEDFAAEATGLGAIGVLHKPPSAGRLGEIIHALGEPAPRSPPPAPAAADELGDAAERIESAVLAAVRGTLSSEAAAAEQSALGEQLGALEQRFTALEQSLDQRLTAFGERIDALDGALRGRPDLDHVRDLAREECDALRISLKDEIAQLQTAVKSLRNATPPPDLSAEIAALREQVGRQAPTPDSQREELIQAARSAASVEAADVATRTVMNASAKIADRLAESIVASLNSKKR